MAAARAADPAGVGAMTRRGVAVAAVLAFTVGCSPAPLPLPVAPYQARNLGTMVTGRVVLASVQLRTTSGVMDVDQAGICVDGGADFPMGDHTVTESWVTISSTRAFPPGGYTARACVTDDGHRQDVAGLPVTFTVN